MNLEEALKHPEHLIVDVRTPGEFEGDGRVEESKNIPLQEVPQRVEEFKAMPRPLILCCRSGGRSQQAMEFLQKQGLDEMVNGMGWQNVDQTKKKLNHV